MKNTYGNWVRKGYAELNLKAAEMHNKEEPTFDEIPNKFRKKIILNSLRKDYTEKRAGTAVRRARSGHPGLVCAPIPGGPWAQYSRARPVGARGVLGW